MKKRKGFSLVEMVVAIIVIGILSIVSVPVYRGYVKRAYESEGKALLGSIVTGEEHFYITFDCFAETEETESFADINVDANNNKYFRSFSIEVDGEEFTATTYGTDAAKGIELSLVYTPNGTQVYETYADASTGGSGSYGGGDPDDGGDPDGDDVQVDRDTMIDQLVEEGVSYQTLKDYGVPMQNITLAWLCQHMLNKKECKLSQEMYEIYHTYGPDNGGYLTDEREVSAYVKNETANRFPGLLICGDLARSKLLNLTDEQLANIY